MFCIFDMRDMKRNPLFILFFLLIAWGATSCDSISNCETCKWVTTDSSNGDVIEAPDEIEYCGADLIAIKTKSYTDGTCKTVYKCH
jgi:hypothetical protein